MPTHLATPRSQILRRLAFLTFAPFLALPTRVLAADSADAVEAAYLADLPVVLSATRLQQARADTPGSVTVIDRHMIRAAGVRNIHELFLLVPGFQVGMHTGNRPLVTYHGLSDEAPRRMLVQVDGRSVYSPYFIAGVEWNQLGVDIDDIERIEVFRGSNSAAYGSNAFLGVANIITRAPSETRGTSLRYRAGDGGVNDVAVRHGQRIGDVDLRLTAARNHDSGFATINDWRKAELATLRADWAINHDHTLEFQAGWTNNDLGTGKDDNATDPERSSRVTTSFGLLRWRHVPAPDEEVSVTWYHQEENGRDRYALSVPVSSRQSGLPVSIGIPFDFDYGFRAVRDDLEIQRVTNPAAGLRAVFGAGMREDRLDAPLRFNSSERVRSGVNRAFATLEWRASPQWLFNAGFMVEDNSLTGTSLAPRASANYHMTESQTLRFSVNRSHRSPIAFEQKSSMIFTNSAPVVTPVMTIPAGTPISQTFRPSPGLRAERVTTYEIGYLAELRPLHVSFDARLFLERAPADQRWDMIFLDAFRGDVLARVDLASQVRGTPIAFEGGVVLAHAEGERSSLTRYDANGALVFSADDVGLAKNAECLVVDGRVECWHPDVPGRRRVEGAVQRRGQLRRREQPAGQSQGQQSAQDLGEDEAGEVERPVLEAMDLLEREAPVRERRAEANDRLKTQLMRVHL